MQLITRHYRLLLIAILAFAFFTRIYRLHLPERYVFDEVYHAVTAKLISRNDVRAYEWWNPAPEPDTAVDWLHPPLAKYTQALGIKIFGENTFGWRISSVVFGVFVVLATYLLADELFRKKSLSLLAALLASLDGLLLVQSRVAMNDIHVTFFILVALLLYVRYFKQKLKLLNDSWDATQFKKTVLYLLGTGLATGLAMGSKWSGMYVLMVIIVSELVHFGWKAVQTLNDKKSSYPLLSHFKFSLGSILPLFVLPWILYIASYAHMFAQGKSLLCFTKEYIQGECYLETFKLGEQPVWSGYVSHFVALHKQIWWYQTHLDATHPYQSRPLQWFLDLKPVWYHVESQSSGYIANIYALGNPILFWAGGFAAIFSVIWLLSHLTNIKDFVKNKEAQVTLLFLVFSYFAVWSLWQLSPRIMFFYHYTPAVPLMSIILSFWLSKLFAAKNRLYVYGAGALVFLIFGVFVIWYPNWTGIMVPLNFAEDFYFAIKSWR